MLTEDQLAASETNASKVVVEAGAGTGKTTVLSARIRHLIEAGVSPGSILAITFTRKAARELAERTGGNVATGTFHSVFLRELQKQGRHLNVLESTDALMDEVAASLGLAINGKYIKKSRSHWAKQVQAYRNGVQDAGGPFVDSYLTRLAMNGDTDYDGLLVEGVRMVQGGGFDWVQHLIVDEVQDNEPLQWKWVMEMAKHASVMLCGDRAQCIYQFRGARPELMDSVKWDRLQIGETFRCPQYVCDIANRLPVSSIALRSSHNKGQLYVRECSVSEMCRARPPEEIAVLCRYNNQVDRYIDELRQFYPIASKKTTPKGPVSKLLKWLANPGSKTARREAAAAWSSNAVRPLLWAKSDMGDTALKSLVQNWLLKAGGAVGDVVGMLDETEESVSIMRQWKDASIQDCLAEMCMSDLVSSTTTGITVDTIHGAKGLEWPCVILPDLHEWPRKNAKEEEYRLFYVGITRTKEDLALLYRETKGPFFDYVKE